MRKKRKKKKKENKKEKEKEKKNNKLGHIYEQQFLNREEKKQGRLPRHHLCVHYLSLFLLINLPTEKE